MNYEREIPIIKGKNHSIAIWLTTFIASPTSPSHTPFIAPVSSVHLHTEAKTQSFLHLNANKGPASPSVGMQRAMEAPHKEQMC